MRLIREAFRDSLSRHTLLAATDGEAALALLRHNAGNSAEPRPALVILDLNLPGMSGFEVLARIKTDPQLAGIPVLILTSSRAENDLRRAYQLHANCYLVKPPDYESFIARLRTIEDFWLTCNELPSGETV